MRFSRVLAWTFGLLAPIGETVRRWHTWREFPPSLFDDSLMGLLLVGGAWSAGRHGRRGQALLATAWGFTCGLGSSSFFEQLRRYGLGEPDPGPISSAGMVAIKGVGLALAVLALILTLQAHGRAAEPSRSDGNLDRGHRGR